MKTYTAWNQIRLVGKVWEIRRYLKLAMQRTSGDILLADFVSGQIGYSCPQVEARKEEPSTRVIPFPER